MDTRLGNTRSKTGSRNPSRRKKNIGRIRSGSKTGKIERRDDDGVIFHG